MLPPRRGGLLFPTPPLNMMTARTAWLCMGLIVSGTSADDRPAASPVKTTPKLEVLNKQIAANPENAQAYSNRGYVLALLGRKEEARADLKRALELKDDAPMHNRVGWAYFNMGDYADSVRECETAA